MQYDVFISYSRKDAQEVNSLIDLLRREIPNLKIWYDIEGIETAEEFRNKIIAALDESNAVIFACSDNSLASKYCEKEVMYAKNVGKTVVPYLLPGTKLKGWLLFEYGNINCIHATNPDEVSRMIKDLRRWSGNDGSAQNTTQNTPSSNSLESRLIFDPETGEFKENTKINGHEYVDLGLPSGVKWATLNIGANKEHLFGQYFDWGTPWRKPSYTEETCKTFGKSNLWLKENHYITSNDTLTPEYDVATKKWGAPWRLPTEAEIIELINNTTHHWVTQNNVKGCLLKSKRNNNSIFFPAQGWMTGASIKGPNIFGYYWGSQPDKDDPKNAFGFYFTMSTIQCKSFDRSCGRAVRPVSE